MYIGTRCTSWPLTYFWCFYVHSFILWCVHVWTTYEPTCSYPLSGLKYSSLAVRTLLRRLLRRWNFGSDCINVGVLLCIVVVGVDKTGSAGSFCSAVSCSLLSFCICCCCKARGKIKSPVHSRSPWRNNIRPPCGVMVVPKLVDKRVTFFCMCINNSEAVVTLMLFKPSQRQDVNNPAPSTSMLNSSPDTAVIAYTTGCWIICCAQWTASCKERSMCVERSLLPRVDSKIVRPLWQQSRMYLECQRNNTDGGQSIVSVVVVLNCSGSRTVLN